MKIILVHPIMEVANPDRLVLAVESESESLARARVERETERKKGEKSGSNLLERMAISLGSPCDAVTI